MSRPDLGTYSAETGRDVTLLEEAIEEAIRHVEDAIEVQMELWDDYAYSYENLLPGLERAVRNEIARKIQGRF